MAHNSAKNSAKNRVRIRQSATVSEYLVVDRTELENKLGPRILPGVFSLLFASLICHVPVRSSDRRLYSIYAWRVHGISSGSWWLISCCCRIEIFKID